MQGKIEAFLFALSGIIAQCDDCRVLSVDFSDPDETRAITNKAKQLFGKIDILINNAGKLLLRSSGCV